MSKFTIITEGGSKVEIFSVQEGMIPEEVLLEVNGKKYKVFAIEVVENPEDINKK